MSNGPRARRSSRTPAKTERAALRRAGTFWNGEPTPARKVRVRVVEPEIPTWWFAGLGGTERDAVEVTYDDQTFLLDDEDGSGWAKVTEGHGGPNSPHRSLDGIVIGERA